MFYWSIFIISGLLAWPTCAESSWLQPNAWELHSPSSANECPVCDIPNEGSVVSIFYKEMITQLFNKNHFKKNPTTGKLERTLVFSLTPAQLTIIENASDLRDLNAIVMLALANAKHLEQVQPTEKNKESTLSLLVSIPKYIYYGLTHIWLLIFYIFDSGSEARFGMFIAAALMTIWLIHKRYNKNLILVLLGSFLVVGYFCTYVECNRKLKAEEYIEFIRENEPDEQNFFTRHIGKYFKLSAKEQKIQNIKNRSQIKFPFCRPDHVAIMYFNEMFFNQLQVVVEKIVESMTVIQNKVPFPFNYLGMIALPFLFMSILPLLFQNILNPVSWFKIFQGTTSEQGPTRENVNNNSVEGDRLSGENLTIFLRALKNKHNSEEKTKHSAVENVKDVPQPIEPKLNESSSDIPQKNTEILSDSFNDIPGSVAAKLNENSSKYAQGTTEIFDENLSESFDSCDEEAVLIKRRTKKTL